MTRLEAILSLLDPCESIVDIGSDHGYLARMIADKNLARRIHVTDVAEGPLSSAKENLMGYPVEYYLMDGLKGFTLPLNAAVIAGMGGELIARIVEESLEIFCGLDYFVVQPMQQLSHLRRTLYELGFYLEKEVLVREEKFYEILLYRRGQDEAYDFAYSKGLFQEMDLYRSYLAKKRAELDYILEATHKRDSMKYEKTLELIERLRRDCSRYGIVL